jgi:hypothetical protein
MGVSFFLEAACGANFSNVEKDVPSGRATGLKNSNLWWRSHLKKMIYHFLLKAERITTTAHFAN